MQEALISRALTAKQSRFIDEYMVDMNGAAVALRLLQEDKPAVKSGGTPECLLLGRLGVQRPSESASHCRPSAPGWVRVSTFGIASPWADIGMLRGPISLTATGKEDPIVEW